MIIDNNFLSSNFITPISSNNTNTSDSKNMFSDLLGSISNQENSVTKMQTEFLNGERDDIDNILIEYQKLNLQLSFALEVRNNLVNMYNQLSNMQI